MIFGFLAANFWLLFSGLPTNELFRGTLSFLFETYLGWVLYFCYPYGHPPIKILVMSQPGPQ